MDGQGGKSKSAIKIGKAFRRQIMLLKYLSRKIIYGQQLVEGSDHKGLVGLFHLQLPFWLTFQPIRKGKEELGITQVMFHSLYVL